MNTQEKEVFQEDEVALRIANSLSVQDQSSLRMTTLFSDSPVTSRPKNSSHREASRPCLSVVNERIAEPKAESNSVEFGGFSFGVTMSELDTDKQEAKTYERKGTGYLGMNTRSRYAS
ncbi:hypothetical protein LMH73_011890 [Vibrio splendidus]|nr:hypothetical protein [Vibrio splendidus]MCC4881549.1 hypothetical protein [Vibrio splendidus]